MKPWMMKMTRRTTQKGNLNLFFILNCKNNRRAQSMKYRKKYLVFVLISKNSYKTHQNARWIAVVYNLHLRHSFSSGDNVAKTIKNLWKFVTLASDVFKTRLIGVNVAQTNYMLKSSWFFPDIFEFLGVLKAWNQKTWLQKLKLG